MLKFIASTLGTLIILGLAAIGLDTLVAKVMVWKDVFDRRGSAVRPVN